MEDMKFINSETAKKLASYKLPRYEQLVQYPVIMSQLVTILDDYLSVFCIPGEEKLITQSMINSYVRNKVIEPPENKTYNRKHIIHLIFLGIMKQILPIADIGEIIEMQRKQYPVEIAYNYFCTEVEEALGITFGSRQLSDFNNAPTKVTSLSESIHSAVIAFANKIYVRQSIYYSEHIC